MWSCDYLEKAKTDQCPPGSVLFAYVLQSTHVCILASKCPYIMISDDLFCEHEIYYIYDCPEREIPLF